MAVLEMSRSAPACNLFSLPGDSTMNAQYALTHFVNDDGYLRWLAQNPDGFVVNSNRVPVSSYLILHRASCNWINISSRINWPTTGYIKTCSTDLTALTELAERDQERLHASSPPEDASGCPEVDCMIVRW